jgi:hypothetical protein
VHRRNLFAWARSLKVGSNAQIDHYSIDDEPSAYELLWSYFSSLAASDASRATVQHD